MKLIFDSNLGYQQVAIKFITDLFEGQPLEDSILEFNFKEDGTLNLVNGVQSIQAINEIKVSEIEL